MKFIVRKVLSIMLALALSLNCSIPAFASPSHISEEEAQEIVLSHTGVDAANAVFTKVLLNEKKNIYTIKFTCGSNKYEYEINAADGTVLTYEWDMKEDNGNLSPSEPEGRPDYAGNCQEAEGAALALLGITRENAKYINSYVKYTENRVAYAIHVEVGIYDRAVSPQTVVYTFEFNMDGEIIEQPAPSEPVIPGEPTAPEPEEPGMPEGPTAPEPEEPNAPAEPEPTEPSVPEEPTEPSMPAGSQPITPSTSVEQKPSVSVESVKPAKPDKSESAQTKTTKQTTKKVVTKSIKVNRTKVSLKKGKKFVIKVTRKPAAAQDKITFSTSKKKVATVSKKGVITAKGKGTCKITVKCNGKKKVIRVTVK